MFVPGHLAKPARGTWATGPSANSGILLLDVGGVGSAFGLSQGQLANPTRVTFRLRSGQALGHRFLRNPTLRRKERSRRMGHPRFVPGCVGLRPTGQPGAAVPTWFVPNRDFGSGLRRRLSASTLDPSLRSGFRQRAQTPAKRLNLLEDSDLGNNRTVPKLLAQ